MIPGGYAQDVPADGGDLEKLKQEALNLQNRIALRIMSLPAIRESAFPVIQNVLSIWAGKNAIKKLLAGQIFKHSLHFMETLEKAADASGQDPAAELGRFLQLQCQIGHLENLANPKRWTENIEKELASLLKNFDFGDLKEFIESSSGSMVDMAVIMQNFMQNYPGKMAAVLASIPALVSATVRSLHVMVKGNLQVAPDMQMDMLAGLAGRINGHEIGAFLNDRMDSDRMLNIGSRMQGDGKTPELQNIVAGKLREILPHIDPVILGKMRTGQAENREAVQNGFSDVLREHPEITRKVIANYPIEKNAQLRALKNRLNVLTDLPEEDLAASAEQGLDALDTSELSEIISAILALIRSIHERKPALLPKIIHTIAQSIDYEEMESFADGVLKETMAALKPAAAPFMPALVNGFCDYLTPSPGEDAGELSRAISRLSRVINQGGEQ